MENDTISRTPISQFYTIPAYIGDGAIAYGTIAGTFQINGAWDVKSRLGSSRKTGAHLNVSDPSKSSAEKSILGTSSIHIFHPIEAFFR